MGLDSCLQLRLFCILQGAAQYLFLGQQQVLKYAITLSSNKNLAPTASTVYRAGRPSLSYEH